MGDENKWKNGHFTINRLDLHQNYVPIYYLNIFSLFLP